MTAYQLQLLTGSGISRQEVLGPLHSSISSSSHVCTAPQPSGCIHEAGWPGLHAPHVTGTPFDAMPGTRAHACHAVPGSGAAIVLSWSCR